LVRLYAPANRVRAPSSRPEVDLRFSPTLPVQKTSLRPLDVQLYIMTRVVTKISQN